MAATRILSLAAGAVMIAGANFAAPAARADEHERFTLLEENDSLYFNSDKHYTQGVRFSYLGPEVASGSGWNGSFDAISIAPGVFAERPAGERSRRYAIALGQSVFTPKETALAPPDPKDRPYAGWLYLSASLLQETDRRELEQFEVELGVIGPAALGKPVQNNWHQLIGKDEAQGWSEQLQNEPGIVLSYDRRWRVPVLGDAVGGVDIVPEAGATLGNVFTYGEAGGLLRLGRNLGGDYGPVRIRPSLSGTDYVNADHLVPELGYYFFVGAQGRVVGRNVFLDGNSFRSSRSVDKKTLVADLQAGLTLFSPNGGFRLDFSVVRRTAEFDGQGTPDVIGIADLSFAW
jgi:lipid A 3-O-deacylase